MKVLDKAGIFLLASGLVLTSCEKKYRMTVPICNNHLYAVDEGL